jgi:hypothetical protein
MWALSASFAIVGGAMITIIMRARPGGKRRKFSPRAVAQLADKKDKGSQTMVTSCTHWGTASAGRQDHRPAPNPAKTA